MEETGKFKSKAEYVTFRRNYVEGLATSMNALVDFDSIKYAWSVVSDEEFVKISDIIEGNIYLDVTDLSRAEILKDVSRCILMGDEDLNGLVPDNVIKDKNRIREISKLFR